MKKITPRLLQVALLLSLASLLSGCAALADGLAMAAEELRAEQEARDPYNPSAYPYDYPREPANVSAPGIK